VWAHFSYFIEGRRKDENKRPQAIRRQQISKTVSPATPATRSAARVQHVALQFGEGPGMHLQFTSAARERLVMKRTTLPAFLVSHGDGSRWSLMGPVRQQERRCRTAPRTHGMFVRLARRLRSITSASKKRVRPQSKRHSLDIARQAASGQVADRAETPLRTEQVVSFADVCCAKRSPCGL
jgi:hypothetical protein